MSENLKLSEASKLCGVSVRTLQLLIADGLLPRAVRNPRGHVHLPSDALPTRQECRDLVARQRERHLARAADLISRLQVELEAVANDIAEARDHPAQELGVDLLTGFGFGVSHGSPFATALHQFELARITVKAYDEALREIV